MMIHLPRSEMIQRCHKILVATIKCLYDGGQVVPNEKYFKMVCEKRDRSKMEMTIEMGV